MKKLNEKRLCREINLISIVPVEEIEYQLKNYVTFYKMLSEKEFSDNRKNEECAGVATELQKILDTPRHPIQPGNETFVTNFRLLNKKVDVTDRNATGNEDLYKYSTDLHKKMADLKGDLSKATVEETLHQLHGKARTVYRDGLSYRFLSEKKYFSDKSGMENVQKSIQDLRYEFISFEKMFFKRYKQVTGVL